MPAPIIKPAKEKEKNNRKKKNKKRALQEPSHTNMFDGVAEGAIAEAVFLWPKRPGTMDSWNLNQPNPAPPFTNAG